MDRTKPASKDKASAKLMVISKHLRKVGIPHVIDKNAIRFPEEWDVAAKAEKAFPPYANRSEIDRNGKPWVEYAL